MRYIIIIIYIFIYSNCRFFPAVVRELNSQDQSKLQNCLFIYIYIYIYIYITKQNYGSIKNYNSEFHAQKQSSGSRLLLCMKLGVVVFYGTVIL